MEPSEACNKGETNDQGKQERFSSWTLYSPLDRNEQFLDSHIGAILDKLDIKKEQFQKLISQYDSGINCVGRFYSPNPGFDLSSALLKRLVQYGLELQFDIYCNCEKYLTEEKSD